MSLNGITGMNVPKVQKAFGKLFPTIDFEISDTLTAEVFRQQGKKATVGSFKIGGKEFQVNLEELDRIIETATNASQVVNKAYRIGRFR